MHKVPKVNLADPSVEPTDEELHALMSAVRDSVVARRREAQAKFLRRLDDAIRGREGDQSRPPDSHELAR